jgi:hypothetical protein
VLRIANVPRVTGIVDSHFSAAFNAKPANRHKWSYAASTKTPNKRTLCEEPTHPASSLLQREPGTRLTHKTLEAAMRLPQVAPE